MISDHLDFAEILSESKKYNIEVLPHESLWLIFTQRTEKAEVVLKHELNSQALLLNLLCMALKSFKHWYICID